MSRTIRSFRLNSEVVIFERPRPYPRFFIYLREGQTWRAFEFSHQPMRKNGVQKFLGVVAVIPYVPGLKRIGLRECPWSVQKSIELVRKVAV